MRHNRYAWIVVLAALAFVPLSSAAVAQKGTRPMPLFSRPKPADAAGIGKIVASDNRLGFRLLDEILRKEDKNSVCVSPISLALALQMTYNGAAGTTQAGMAQALGLEKISLDELNQSNSSLLAGLVTPAAPAQAPTVGNSASPPSPTQTAETASHPAVPSPQLDIANSLWLRRREQIRPDFIQRAQQFYHVQISDLRGAPKTINDWVAQHTNHKIPQIVTARDVAGIEAALVNAVYFKGLWKIPFDSKRTAEKLFHPTAGNAQPCQMMLTEGKFSYYQDAQLQMVSLPYAGSRLEMLLLLPAPKTALRDIVHQATPENWEKWTTSLNVQSGTVELPRFPRRVRHGVERTIAEIGHGRGVPTYCQLYRHEFASVVHQQGDP